MFLKKGTVQLNVWKWAHRPQNTLKRGTAHRMHGNGHTTPQKKLKRGTTRRMHGNGHTAPKETLKRGHCSQITLASCRVPCPGVTRCCSEHVFYGGYCQQQSRVMYEKGKRQGQGHTMRDDITNRRCAMRVINQKNLLAVCEKK